MWIIGRRMTNRKPEKGLSVDLCDSLFLGLQAEGGVWMRREEFKMERTGLLAVGEVLPVTEGKLPNSYYYTLGKAYAMSANYPVSERIRSQEGRVADVRKTPKGYFVTVEFDE